MNPNISKLQPYPFEKLATLKKNATLHTHKKHLSLSIGEPQHDAPAQVTKTLIENINKVEKYPSTKGLPELRNTIAEWTTTRFGLKPGSLSPEQHVLPVNGTREAIFSFAQALIDPTKPGAGIISPNPFYQIYEGAAYLADTNLTLLPCLASNHFLPDFHNIADSVWDECQLLYLCSPGNPTGAVVDQQTLKLLIALADKHDFIIASDECYSEIYCDEANPPIGLLQVCAEIGRDDFSRCVVFHSLSKRSNLPGLRSGFIAGDARLIKPYFSYRTYHGCAMPIHVQLASIAAWQDESHVIENRARYREKFAAILPILQSAMNVSMTDASFYLWPETPICDIEFTQRLFEQQHVTVIPGSFLSREVNGLNPGSHRIRIALVAEVAKCVEAAERIAEFTHTIK